MTNKEFFHLILIMQSFSNTSKTNIHSCSSLQIVCFGTIWCKKTFWNFLTKSIGIKILNTNQKGKLCTELKMHLKRISLATLRHVFFALKVLENRFLEYMMHKYYKCIFHRNIRSKQHRVIVFPLLMNMEILNGG